MSVKSETTKSRAGEFWDVAKVVAQAVAIAIVVRIFLYQPFNIPSGSMEGTLLVGDYLFVSKLSYGYSKYTFMFEPFNFNGRILSGEPQRGDIAVFRKPTETNVDYIKRVIGLPGDRVQMKNGQLFINGTAVPKIRVSDELGTDDDGQQGGIRRYEETLPNGVKYFVLDRVPNGDVDNTGEYLVPPGHYFMMGDNRDNSADSRLQGENEVGYVPLENFIGRSDVIFFSAEPGTTLIRFWEWPWRIRWGRFFNLTR